MNTKNYSLTIIAAALFSAATFAQTPPAQSQVSADLDTVARRMPQPVPPIGCSGWSDQHCVPAGSYIHLLLRPGCSDFTGPGCELPEPYNSNPLCHKGANLVNAICNWSTLLKLQAQQPVADLSAWPLFSAQIGQQ